METEPDSSEDYTATRYRLNLASPVDTSQLFQPVETAEKTPVQRISSKPTALTIGWNVAYIPDKQQRVEIKDHIEKIAMVQDGNQCAIYPHCDSKFVSLTAPFAAGKFTRMTNVFPVTKPATTPPITATSVTHPSQQSVFPAQLFTSLKNALGSGTAANSQVT